MNPRRLSNRTIHQDVLVLVMWHLNIEVKKKVTSVSSDDAHTQGCCNSSTSEPNPWGAAIKLSFFQSGKRVMNQEQNLNHQISSPDP